MRNHRKILCFFFALDLISEIMSNKSYVLPTDSKEELEMAIPVEEPVSSPNNEALQKRYVQIAIAVALYW
jgi:hypothetical protein